ncbi:fumarylacetoacetate hydrolase family protein [Terricaulis silvestris]|uniref:Ureidoglycolate lyase n=1 Tax=Terricaulis silvestris TaxID=2686094 RepID=A0A6I6MM68_9CAUL|nr:fumarylacetoacetate hydrolase family protein [Terricaulis silvestris]QGZ93817.1 Ureidoglycolate lyase [Terricaulis silvestris]
MKIATFTEGGRTRLGVVQREEIADVSVADARLPQDMVTLLEAGTEAQDALAAAAERAPRLALKSVRLEAPVMRPRKFLGLGLSFKSHVEEIRARGVPIPLTANQVWFNKQVTSISGPYDPIHLPRVSSQLDYEGEVAFVIGKKCRHVPADKASDVIAGFLICNDVSVRDWQLRSPTSTLGKSFDTHGPIGPWLTTADDVENPHDLRIRTWVDDELRQDGSTSDFVYSIGEMIAELTTVFTLEPGDVLTTGCPAGVGAMFDPPRFMKAGQKVRVEVDGLGAIENPVIDEPTN